jgi:4-hydroxy-2-oxoheptanedioate aldolase
VQIPRNTFKRRLLEHEQQIGLWVGLGDPYVAELLATTGFDWLLIDAEHAPNDPRSVLPQLQAVAAYGTSPIVRPVAGSVDLIKQYLDIGCQTILVPMVETREQAELMVAATRYPTRGIRGVGSALSRASRWNQVDDYLALCESEMCVLVQVESTAGMGNLAEIASVDGLDGVFFGPADLAASMGRLGKPSDPVVQAAVEEGMKLVRRSGKAVGTLAGDVKRAHHYLEMGATFVAVGVDTTLLVRAASGLLKEFKGSAPTPANRINLAN